MAVADREQREEIIKERKVVVNKQGEARDKV
jgi:hypothetical protein